MLSDCVCGMFHGMLSFCICIFTRRRGAMNTVQTRLSVGRPTPTREDEKLNASIQSLRVHTHHTNTRRSLQ